MASRRMFSQRIVGSGRFLSMPPSSQALYFHLGIYADDDGVVEAYRVLKLTDSKDDDFRVLVTKGYVKILNEDKVCVIMDWKEHNFIRADRKVDSIYKPLLLLAIPETKLVSPRARRDVKDNSRRIGGQQVDSPRSSEGSIGEDNIPQIPISIRDQINKSLGRPPLDNIQ